jgi:hypothetical protein
MITNPSIRPTLAAFSRPERWVSGMISLLTTKIMAPAANANPHGSSGAASDTAMTPANAPSGSTRPVTSAMPTGLGAAVTDAIEGDRDRQPLRHVLKPDAEGQRETRRGIAGAEADPNRQPFRDVVQRDGDDEQPDPAQTVGLRTLAALDEMLVRDQQIQTPETGRPQQDAGTHHGRPGACFKRRQDQGEEGCRQHHPGGEAQQGVLHPLGNSAEQQQGHGSQAGGGARREAG